MLPFLIVFYFHPLVSSIIMSLHLPEEKNEFLVPDYLTQDLRLKGAKLETTPKKEPPKRIDGVVQDLYVIMEDLENRVKELNADKQDLANQVRKLKAGKKEMKDQLHILQKKCNGYKEHCAAMVRAQLRFEESMNDPWVDYDSSE